MTIVSSKPFSLHYLQNVISEEKKADIVVFPSAFGLLHSFDATDLFLKFIVLYCNLIVSCGNIYMYFIKAMRKKVLISISHWKEAGYTLERSPVSHSPIQRHRINNHVCTHSYPRTIKRGQSTSDVLNCEAKVLGENMQTLLQFSCAA